jgi:predicted amidohydrolase YtcJ
MSRTLLTSARLLDLAGADEEVRTTAATIVIDDGRIASVADQHDDTEADEVIDLANRVVLPGFVDSHVHLVWTGESLAKVALTDAGDLAEIQRRLGVARELLGDDATMLLGKGWLFDAVDGEPTAAMIDAVVSDIPVFLDSNDMHSVWVNSAALRVLGVDATTPDPPAGRISRLPSGEPAGMLYERAAHDIGWAYLTEAVGEDDLRASARRALDAFAAAGVTSVIDMGMDESGWRALQAVAADGGGTLPVRVAAHWAVIDSGDDDENLAQVERAARVAAEATEWLGVIGIKLVLDGVIDACTAAMSHPYTSGGSPCTPSATMRATSPSTCSRRSSPPTRPGTGGLAWNISRSCPTPPPRAWRRSASPRRCNRCTRIPRSSRTGARSSATNGSSEDTPGRSSAARALSSRSAPMRPRPRTKR